MSDDDWCGPACECALCVQELKIKEQAAEIEKLRDVVDALLQHEASSFFGPDAEKHMRASWRGVIRKARAAKRRKMHFLLTNKEMFEVGNDD